MYDYERFKQRILSEGKTHPDSEPSVPTGEPSDDQLYVQYLDLLSGEAARRRSIEDAREEQRQTEQEVRAWAEYTGSPLPRDLEG